MGCRCTIRAGDDLDRAGRVNCACDQMWLSMTGTELTKTSSKVLNLSQGCVNCKFVEPLFSRSSAFSYASQAMPSFDWLIAKRHHISLLRTPYERCLELLDEGWPRSECLISDNKLVRSKVEIVEDTSRTDGRKTSLHSLERRKASNKKGSVCTGITHEPRLLAEGVAALATSSSVATCRNVIYQRVETRTAFPLP